MYELSEDFDGTATAAQKQKRGRFEVIREASGNGYLAGALGVLKVLADVVVGAIPRETIITLTNAPIMLLIVTMILCLRSMHTANVQRQFDFSLDVLLKEGRRGDGPLFRGGFSCDESSKPRLEVEVIGILAFGSLMDDPGPEIERWIVGRRRVKTPFHVEFARYSEKRGGGPTLVPVERGGGHVDAHVLLLSGNITLAEAVDMLWRRETGKVGSQASFELRRRTDPAKTVLIRQMHGFAGLDCVIYTDLFPEGKIADPKPNELAQKAVSSVKKITKNQDGITYFIKAKQAGIRTPLSEQYEREVLKQTMADSLQEALEKAGT
jgi:hypothetical protein